MFFSTDSDDPNSLHEKIKGEWDNNRRGGCVTVDHNGVKIGVEIVSDFASMSVGWAKYNGRRVHYSSHVSSVNKAIELAIQSYNELIEDQSQFSNS